MKWRIWLAVFCALLCLMMPCSFAVADDPADLRSVHYLVTSITQHLVGAPDVVLSPGSSFKLSSNWVWTATIHVRADVPQEYLDQWPEYAPYGQREVWLMWDYDGPAPQGEVARISWWNDNSRIHQFFDIWQLWPGSLWDPRYREYGVVNSYHEMWFTHPNWGYPWGYLWISHQGWWVDFREGWYHVPYLYPGGPLPAEFDIDIRPSGYVRPDGGYSVHSVKLGPGFWLQSRPIPIP